MPDLVAFLTFASDAEIMALWGAGFVMLALMASLAERRRLKRAKLEKLGWFPWTGLFLASMLAGGGLLAFSLPRIIAG